MADQVKPVIKASDMDENDLKKVVDISFSAM
jgi:hypothetical protein